MKLYEISEQYQRKLDSLVEDELSEIETNDIINEVLAIEDDLKTKIDNILAYIKTLEAQGIIYQKEIKRLNKLKKTNDTAKNSLREYLLAHLTKLGIKKMDTPRFKLSIRESIVLEKDAELIPDEYCYYERIPNDSLIKDSIGKGEEIEGITQIIKNIITVR